MSECAESPPEHLVHRVLLAVTGLSPQVLTETLFALAVTREPKWIPHEIRVVTTARGAENVRLQLLSEEPGWFQRLRRDWSLPEITFTADHIHVIAQADGSPLDDIRDDADNLCVADAIANCVCRLTADPATELHASIAGGRKTMGYYLGYAMSLFGRAQDRLSHVLISAPFENHPEFFYPSPTLRVIRSPGPSHDVIDASRAKVWLGDIPFVRLRDGLPQALLQGRGSFAQAIAAAQQRLAPPSLTIDLARRLVDCNGTTLSLPPAELAFLAWFARGAVAGHAGFTAPKVPDSDYRDSYLAEHRRILAFIADNQATARRIQAGIDKSFFEERKSKLKAALVKALGESAAQPYLIGGEGRPKRYRLTLAQSAIRFADIDNMPAVPNADRADREAS